MANCNNTLDYIREHNRMCSTYRRCDNGCPLKGKECSEIKEMTEKHIDIVQKWSGEHPELKPCPICGSPTVITTRSGYGDAFLVCCAKPGCIEMRTGFGSYQQAAEAWNRRNEG